MPPLPTLLTSAVLLWLLAAFLSGVASASSYELPRFAATVSVSFADHRVADGQELPAFLTKVPPTLLWRAASMPRLYTVILIDPDAPSAANPIMAQWLHYLHTNIHGAYLMSRLSLVSSLSARNAAGTLATYAPPSPPDGSGEHRYVLYVYEQSKEIDSEGVKVISQVADMGRARWSVDEWLEKRKAEGVDMRLVAGMHFVVSGAQAGEQQQQQPKQRRRQMMGEEMHAEEAPSELLVKGERDAL